MSKRYFLLVSLITALAFLQSAKNGNSGILDPCRTVLSMANPGVVLVCPFGDGDPLTAPVGGGSCQITVTVRDGTIPNGVPIPGIPAVDMWLVGCSDGLLLCGGGSSGSPADGATNASGITTFSNEPVAGGCDTGVFVVVQGFVAQDPPNSCLPKCLPVATRSPDYKSTAGCPGDNRCPDSKVDNSDFSWLVSHYPTTANPGAPYFACADYAAPFGAPIGLPDFTKFTVHFAGAGHKCPI
jgi:hypothetical protein